MAWNPEYVDMFAASFGSFDFQRQGSGLVACFSLKNPGNPEYLFTTPSGECPYTAEPAQRCLSMPRPLQDAGSCPGSWASADAAMQTGARCQAGQVMHADLVIQWKLAAQGSLRCHAWCWSWYTRTSL